MADLQFLIQPLSTFTGDRNQYDVSSTTACQKTLLCHIAKCMDTHVEPGCVMWVLAVLERCLSAFALLSMLCCMSAAIMIAVLQRRRGQKRREDEGEVSERRAILEVAKDREKNPNTRQAGCQEAKWSRDCDRKPSQCLWKVFMSVLLFLTIRKSSMVASYKHGSTLTL